MLFLKEYLIFFNEITTTSYYSFLCRRRVAIYDLTGYLVFASHYRYINNVFSILRFGIYDNIT